MLVFAVYRAGTQLPSVPARELGSRPGTQFPPGNSVHLALEGWHNFLNQLVRRVLPAQMGHAGRFDSRADSGGAYAVTIISLIATY